MRPTHRFSLSDSSFSGPAAAVLPGEPLCGCSVHAAQNAPASPPLVPAAPTLCLETFCVTAIRPLKRIAQLPTVRPGPSINCNHTLQNIMLLFGIAGWHPPSPILLLKAALNFHARILSTACHSTTCRQTSGSQSPDHVIRGGCNQRRNALR